MTIRPAILLPACLLLLAGCGAVEEEAAEPNISTAGPGELVIPEEEAQEGVPVDLPEAPLEPLPGAPEDTEVGTTTVVED